MMKPIKLGEFIDYLQSIKRQEGDILVGLSVDSEGNAWSLVPDEQFGYVDTCNGELGYQDFDSSGNYKVLILFGSN